MGPGQDLTSIPDKDNLFAIPKLSPDGSNWVTFRTHFLFTMAGHDIEGHFDRSDPSPPLPTYTTPDETKWTSSDRDMHDAYLPLVRK